MLLPARIHLYFHPLGTPRDLLDLTVVEGEGERRRGGGGRGGRVR